MTPTLSAVELAPIIHEGTAALRQARAWRDDSVRVARQHYLSAEQHSAWGNPDKAERQLRLCRAWLMEAERWHNLSLGQEEALEDNNGDS